MIAPRSLEDLALQDVEAVPLDHIALLVARERYPELLHHVYLERLDEFARRAERHIHKVQGGRQIVDALNHYLFQQEGFRGNSADYYNPANNFFNDVLDDRSGIPITLSILYVEIGRRLSLPLSGVSLPGHFMVRYDDPYESFLVDPFSGGKILSENDCRDWLKERYGHQFEVQDDWLQPASKRAILIRILVNLKMIYLARKEFSLALNFLNKMLLFAPNPETLLKERGLIYYQLECFQPALADFESYLKTGTIEKDRAIVERYLQDLKLRVAHIC